MYLVQHKGYSSPGIELVACPIPAGPAACLPWADRPELPLRGSLEVVADAVA